LAEYQKNRTGMAQTYLLKDILDNNTNKVRLDKLARMTEGDDGITGAFSDFGKIYANSPEIFKPLTKEAMPIRFSRWTIPGALGAGIGSAIAPGVGTVMAAGAGTLLGRRMSTKAAQRLASPERQAQYTEALRKQPLTREQMGYEPITREYPDIGPPERLIGPSQLPTGMYIERQSPHPPSPMGGTTVGTGPANTGVVNLGQQLDAGLPSPGAGPQAILRQPSYGEVRGGGNAQFDPTAQSPQMPAVEGNLLTPEMQTRYLGEIMDAMNRGDMELANRLEAEFQAKQAALQTQSPHPAHNLLYEPFRNRPEMPPPSGGSAFAEALRNFKGAQ